MKPETAVLATHVLAQRIRPLPREDRSDLLELIRVLADATDDEEYSAAVHAIQEILDQDTGGIQLMETP